MKLSQLDVGIDAIITKIKCNDDLKQRFYSFGIVKGAQLFVGATSLKKNTIEINIENTNIALRLDEANAIEVQEIS